MRATRSAARAASLAANQVHAAFSDVKSSLKAGKEAKDLPKPRKAAKRGPDSEAPTAAKKKATTEYTESVVVCAEDGSVKKRCWGSKDADMQEYHDRFWAAAALHQSSQQLFHQMTLQVFQCGLTWRIVLTKSKDIAAAFNHFDVDSVAAMTSADVERLMTNDKIIRNRAKLQATINNAKVIQRLDSETSAGFPGFVWSLAPLDPRERLIRDFPDSHMRTEFTSGVDRIDADGVHPTTSIAAASKALKKAGFSFMGETTTLSWFQAAGLVNHHKRDCFRFADCNAQFDAVCASLKIALPSNVHALPDAEQPSTSNSAKRKQ